MTARSLRFVPDLEAPAQGAKVSALWLRPHEPVAAYVFAHGAGAPMTHAFMEAMALALAQRRIATFRYQFPYTEAGRRRPDREPVLLRTVAAAIARARELAGGLPLYAGGKSMGGRMTSLACAKGSPGELAGLVFLGFPLHAAGKPGVERAKHLSQVAAPMLFLQGTRDKLAELDLLQPVLAELGSRARLHIIEDGDHSFHVPKRSGRTDEQVRSELADVIAEFVRR